MKKMNILKRIQTTFRNISDSTKLHFFVGGWFGMVFSGIFKTPIIGIEPLALAVIAVALVAVLTEVVYDGLMKQGVPEVKDGFATFIGGFIAIWLLNIMM